MASIERTADAVWQGTLVGGGGTVTFASGAIEELPVTWASRTEAPDGKTSPEELIAAAHAACYSMALSHILGEGGTPPERLQVSATCRALKDESGLRIAGMHLDVRGTVPGLDAAGFADAAAKAAAGCPVSQVLGKGLDITHSAALET